jgi:hypothetical protein
MSSLLAKVAKLARLHVDSKDYGWYTFLNSRNFKFVRATGSPLMLPKFRQPEEHFCFRHASCCGVTFQNPFRIIDV